MGILDRISTLVKSNLNAAIDSMSDPGKELDQLVVDMEDALKNARIAVKDALTVEKHLGMKIAELDRKLATWEENATTAVRAGDDELAKEALVRRGEIEFLRRDTAHDKEIAAQQVTMLQAALKQLEARIVEVKNRKETLKGQLRARKKGGAADTSAFERFEKLSTAVDVKEAELEVDEELAALKHQDQKSLAMEEKFKQLESGSGSDDISARLAALKEKAGKKSE